MNDLIGKKIVALRGYRYNGHVPLQFVLFDDKETVLELREQDMDFHDCDNRARVMLLSKDAIFWKRLFDKVEAEEPT